MKTWFDPQPPDAPLRLPRQWPKRVVPSLIGESGQVLNLLMHHGARGVVRDYSGYGNHGTIFGASWIDGVFGWALNFDGLTNYLGVPDSGSLNLTTGITLKAWINLAAAPAITARIFVKDTGFGYATYGLAIPPARLLGLYLGGALRVSAITPVSIGLWTNFAATWDSVSTLPRIYINGTLDATGLAYAGPIPTNALPLLIGNTDTLNRGFPGIIAMPSIYNVDKGAVFMRRQYEETRSIFYP